MLSNNLIRTLTNALTGLMLLVSLGIVLLLTSAFLYNQDTPNAADPNWDSPNPPTTVAVVAPLTDVQQHGKELFMNNCAQCHALTADVIVGPGLLGVTSRTPGEAWLIKWIRNSQAVVAAGEPYAVQVYNKFNRIAMSSFPNLTNTDIKAILSYVDTQKPAIINAR